MSAVPGYAQRVELIGFDGLYAAETLHDSLAVSPCTPRSTPPG